MLVLFETQRLNVTSVEAEDHSRLKELLTDVETVKYTGFREPQSEEKIKTLHLKWVKESRKELGVWVAKKKSDNQLIGWVMLKPTNTETPELGYMIYKRYWNQGYATEIAESMLRYGFEVLNLKKIIANTDIDNLGSIKVLEKIGMLKVSTPEPDQSAVQYEVINNNGCVKT